MCSWIHFTMSCVLEPGVKIADGSTPTERRARAFTLFFNAYDQCRRAVGYLRWNEDDADQVAPTLFTGRARRASSAEPAPAESPAATPAAPANDK